MNGEHYTPSRAWLWAGAATLCWSTVATAFKWTLRILHGDVWTLVGWSSACALLVLFPYVVFRSDFRSRLRLSRGLLLSMGMGFLNPCVYYFILFTAYDRLPGQQVLPLNYTWPIILSLLSALIFQSPLSRRGMLAFGFCLVGVVGVVSQGHSAFWRIPDPKGAGLALLSAVIWAVYWLWNLHDPRPGPIKLFWNFFFGTLLYVLWMGLHTTLRLPPKEALPGVVWIGLFEMGLPFLFWLKALEAAPSPEGIGTLVYLSPFLSLVFLNRILGERITTASFLGLCLIIGGVFLSSTRRTS